MAFGHCEYAECIILRCGRLNALLSLAGLDPIDDGAFRQAVKRGGWGQKDQKLQQSTRLLVAVPEGKEKETSDIALEPLKKKKVKCCIIKTEKFTSKVTMATLRKSKTP